jgi:hypothetical protein
MNSTIKNIIKVLVGLFVIVAVAGIYRFNFTNGGDTAPITITQPDPGSMTYKVGNDIFTLKNGKAEIDAAPGSASKNTLIIFSEPVYGDLDKDGDTDAAVLLANTTGGSGVFYYAVLAINNGTSSRATDVMLLGDRIAPQTVEIHEGSAVYNFAERKGTDPMTAQPSIGKSVWVHYDATKNEIGELVKNFEGESAQ